MGEPRTRIGRGDGVERRPYRLPERFMGAGA